LILTRRVTSCKISGNRGVKMSLQISDKIRSAIKELSDYELENPSAYQNKIVDLCRSKKLTGKEAVILLKWEGFRYE